MTVPLNIPSVTVTYARSGSSTAPNEFGMREMQERCYERRGEQYLLLKSPPASGKSRALMFIALDKLKNPGNLNVGNDVFSLKPSLFDLGLALRVAI